MASRTATTRCSTTTSAGGGPPRRGADALDVTNPATGEVLARVPLSSAADLDAAVQAARAALPAWRGVSRDRAARGKLFALREGLDERREDLARSVTTEMGKTIGDARAEVARMIEMVEAACAIPTTMQGRILEDVSRSVDAETIRQPVGVCAAIVPFNFPAMVPFWFLPFAIGCGNTFVLKPSEQVPLTQQIAFEVLDSLDLPPGVVNLVNGGREVVEGILDHPGIDAVSFVGCAPVAQDRLRALGQGRQARAGARRRQEPHGRDARRRDRQDRAAASSAPRSARPASAAWPARSSSRSARRTSGCCPPLQGGDRGAAASATASTRTSTLGPVVSEKARERILRRSSAGCDEGAALVVDGREAGDGVGCFVGPTILDGVAPGDGRRPRGDLRPGALARPRRDARRGHRGRELRAASATASRSSPSPARPCGATGTRCRRA